MKTKKLGIALGLLVTASALFANELYKENVVASYYADKFNGRRTTSGEIFDMNGYTAAHKTLPFGTILRVTNLDNGKSVNVRVNDRGPFVTGREIDVSKAAAIALDMINEGTAKVSLVIVENESEGLIASSAQKNEVIIAATEKSEEEDVIYDPLPEPEVKAAPEPVAKPTTTKTTASSTKTATKPDQRWDIQLGAYSNAGNAKAMAHKLLQAGFDNVAYQTIGTVTRVVLRDIATDDLDEVQTQLDKNGFTQYIVRERKNVIIKE